MVFGHLACAHTQKRHQQSTTMTETSTTEENAPVKIEVLVDPDTDACATFILHDEDHTLGNSLHYVLMKNPLVEFSGYTVPHPSETKTNLRIQTTGVPAVDSLKQGLTDLKSICNHILETFDSVVTPEYDMKP